MYYVTTHIIKVPTNENLIVIYLTEYIKYI